MQTKLTMRYPSAWHNEMWREGAPFGNGLIGGVVYGGILKEHIVLNHAFLWSGGKNCELPDISNTLPQIRRLLDENKTIEADGVIGKALKDKGYHGEFVIPRCVCDIIIETSSRDLFSHYRREIDMSKAEVTVHWQEEETFFCRSTFVSRKNQPPMR